MTKNLIFMIQENYYEYKKLGLHQVRTLKFKSFEKVELVDKPLNYVDVIKFFFILVYWYLYQYFSHL